MASAAVTKPSDEEIIATFKAAWFKKMHEGDEPVDFIPVRTNLERHVLGADIAVGFKATSKREPSLEDAMFTLKGKPLRV